MASEIRGMTYTGVLIDELETPSQRRRREADQLSQSIRDWMRERKKELAEYETLERAHGENPNWGQF